MNKILALIFAAGAVVGCSDAKIASSNLSKAAENFELNRRIVFYNGITGEYMLSIEGLCSIGSATETKADLVDGKASYYDTWMHGCAAPLGQPTFHVVLDFASDTTFNSVVAWWHRDVGGHAVPNDVDIQIWNAVTSAWDTVFSTTNARDSLGPYDDPTTWTSRPTAFSFATVTSDKLLLVYDNLELWNQYREHGWLHEVSVYNESAVPEPGSLVLLGLGLAGLGYVRKRRS